MIHKVGLRMFVTRKYSQVTCVASFRGLLHIKVYSPHSNNQSAKRFTVCVLCSRACGWTCYEGHKFYFRQQGCQGALEMDGLGSMCLKL